jgi:NADPH:quinone reductase-like Zn-dependent oxidoreductase
LRPAERVLIHAVGSGVGLAAVQLARTVSAIPFGTSRTRDKIDRAREYGLEYGTTDTDALAGFDVVIDLVGGQMVEKSVEALAPRGRLVLVGTVGGSRAELPLGKVLAKRLRIYGTVLRSRPVEEKIAVTRAFAAEVVPLLAAGRLRPVVDSAHPLERIREAHALLESNTTFGKVVLTVD